MVQIYINDANILIDLCDLDIIEEFLALDFELCTTDFVMAELEERQKRLFQDKLVVLSTEPGSFAEIVVLVENHSSLSFEDCTIWYHAIQKNGVMITSDKPLRKAAEAKGTSVRGILHLFDEMKIQNCMPLQKCISKLEELKLINPRAPKNLIDQLIANWLKIK